MTGKPLAPPPPRALLDPQGNISDRFYKWLGSVSGGMAALFTGATAADYRGNAAGSLALTPGTVWDAAGAVGLTDGAFIPVDMSAGFNFDVTIAGNRTLANPSNAKQGQAGVFHVAASGATRTINKGSNYFSSDAVSWPVSIPAGSVVYIYYHVWQPGTIIITGVIGPNFN